MVSKEIDFLQWFDGAVEEFLKKPIDQCTIEEILDGLWLEGVTSRETIRRIKNDKIVPSRAAQKIIEVVEGRRDARNRSGGRDIPGTKTRIQVERLLNAVAKPFAREQPVPLPTDVLVESGFGPKRLRELFRCIDDADTRDSARPSWDDVLRRAREDLDVGYDAIYLITHRAPSAAAQTRVAAMHRDNIVIETAAAFYGRFLDIDFATNFFQQQLKDQLDNNKIPLCTVPATIVSADSKGGSQLDIGDCLTHVEQSISSAQGTKLAVLAEFGTGKSTITTALALKLLGGSNRAGTACPLPIVVPGAQIRDADELMWEAVRREVKRIYRCELDEAVIKSLWTAGVFVLVIDGLDESPFLTSANATSQLIETLVRLAPGETESLSKSFIATMRTELFSDDEAEKEGVCAAIVDRMYLRGLRPTEARRALAQIFPLAPPAFITRLWSILDDKDDAGSSILTRPLFLHFLSSLDDHHRRRLETQIDKEENPTINDLLLWLHEEVADQWYKRESRKGRSHGKLHPTHRIEFAKEAAVRVADPVRHEKLLTVNELQEIAKNVALRLSLDPNSSALHFTEDAQLSMLLVRPPESNEFRFSHAGVFEFFLAKAIDDALGHHEYQILERVILGTNWEMFFRFLYAIEQQPAKHKRILRLLEAAGNIDANSKLSESVIRSPIVTQNILFTASRFAAITSNRSTLRIKGLNLSGATLADNIVAQASSVVTEFAKTDVVSSDGKYLTEPRRATSWSAQEDSLRQSWGALKDIKANNSEISWCVIPGGIYSVKRHIPAAITTSDQSSEWSTRSSIGEASDRIFVPSFLIQRHPVTNREFLLFLQSESGRQWRPEAYRNKNEKYLEHWRIWRKLPDDVTQWPTGVDSVSRLSAEGMAYKDWLNFPVVFVSCWPAEACAHFYKARLPSEAEYLIAGLAFRPASTDTAFPWPEETLDGYALTANAGVKIDDLAPYFNCTTLDDDKIKLAMPKFCSWAKEIEATLGVLPPFHLLGLIREWTSDFWDSNWPLSDSVDHAHGDHRRTWLYPRNTGLTLDSSGLVRRHLAQSGMRAVRAGSLRSDPQECLLTQRRCDESRFCNPDYGFRLARPLLPW